MIIPTVPQSRISVFNLVPDLSSNVSLVQKTIEPGVQKVVEPKAETAKEPAEVKPIEKPAEPAVAKESQTVKPPTEVRRAGFGLKAAVPFVWLAGALVLAGYVLVGNFRLWWIVKRQRPVTEQRILDLLEDCKSQIGVQTILGVVVTEKVKSPALFGFIRPRLLLPKKKLLCKKRCLPRLRTVKSHAC